MIKSQVLKEVGLFDERFFMYIEESDLCERINKKYKLFINPNSKVYHDESSSTKKTNGINYFAKYYIRRNQLLFSMKNYNFKNKFILRFSLLLKDIVYIILHINDKKYRYIIFHAWLDYILKKFYRNEKIEDVINS